MKIFFKKKKSIFIFLLILFLMIIFLCLFYYLKNSLQKEECLQEIDAMNYRQIVDEINKITKVNDPAINDENFRKNKVELNLAIINYLSCSFYKEVKEFHPKVWAYLYDINSDLIFSLEVPQELKDSNRKKIDKFYGNLEAIEPTRNQINTNIALTPFDEMCSNGALRSDLLADCLDRAAEKRKENHECHNICGIIAKYKKDFSNLLKDIENHDLLLDDHKQLWSQSLSRASLAFRFGGEELAMKTLAFLPKDEIELKIDTENYIKSLAYAKKRLDSNNAPEGWKEERYELCLPEYEKIKKKICVLKAEAF